MQIQRDTTGNLGGLTSALLSYLEESDKQYALVERCEATTAIHDTQGGSLEVYRMYAREAVTIECLRDASQELPSSEESPYWNHKPSALMKLQKEVKARLEKHQKQFEVLTRGIYWNGRPILIHAYKFEPDPRVKVELIVPEVSSPLPELPIRILVDALECHEFLIPSYIAVPVPYYEGHDASFLSLNQYLSKTMPKNLYATQCLQRVSCHASNGVGSRGTLREHTGALASHSQHGQSPQAT